MCDLRTTKSRISGRVHEFMDEATFRLYETPLTPQRLSSLRRLYGYRLAKQIAAFWSEGAALARAIDAKRYPQLQEVARAS